MTWKKIAAGGLAGFAGAALLISTVNSAAAASHADQAFGIQVQALGSNVLAPTPLAQTADGSLVKESLVAIPANDSNPTLSLPIPDGAPITAGVLEAQAEAGQSQARVANLDLGGLISAQLLQASCDDTRGATEIAGLTLAGNDLSGLAGSPAPNTVIGVPGVLTVTLNEQTANDDGSVTVNAVHVEVAPDLTAAQLSELTGALSAEGLLSLGAGTTALSQVKGLSPTMHHQLARKAASSDALVDVVVSSATCGPRASDPTSEPTDSEPTDGDGGAGDPTDGANGEPTDGSTDGSSDEAPTPTPVQTQHPVTG